MRSYQQTLDQVAQPSLEAELLAALSALAERVKPGADLSDRQSINALVSQAQALIEKAERQSR